MRALQDSYAQSAHAIAALVEQTRAMLQPQADELKVTISANLPANLPEVDVDPERMIQVLSNLL